MERREQARKHGFTEMIDCGGVILHVFHENSLYQNLPGTTKRAVNLSEITFPDEEIPLLTHSGIEILPGVGHRAAELYGYITFDAPTAWGRRLRTFETQYTELQEYLEGILEFHTDEFEQTNDALYMSSTSHQDVRITFKRLDRTTVCVEIHAPVDETKPQSFLYDDIINYTTLWGRLHDFVIRCSALPYKQPVDSPWNTIYIGTTSEMSVSEIELAIETQIGKRQIENSQMPLIGWADDVCSATIEAYQQSLPGTCNTDSVAETIVQAKHELSQRLGHPISITQQDIIHALTRHIKRPDSH